jgi:hypothetical protein
MSTGKLTGVSVVNRQSLALTWDDGQTATVDLARVIAGRNALALSQRQPLLQRPPFQQMADRSNGRMAVISVPFNCDAGPMSRPVR